MSDNGLMIGDFALYYESLGWRSVLVPAVERKPRVTGPQRDLGILLGKRSGGLIGIEFFWQEAQELGEELLRALPSYGSDISPFRYRLARGKLRTDILQFKLPAAAANLFNARSLVLLEMRGDGHEIIVPPSGESDGERLAWNGPLDDIPTKKEGELEDIGGTIATLAAVTYAYRRTSGNRDIICQALAGALVHAGLHPSDVDLCVEKVAFSAFDDDWFLRGSGAAEIRLQVTGGAHGLRLSCAESATSRRAAHGPCSEAACPVGQQLYPCCTARRL